MLIFVNEGDVEELELTGGVGYDIRSDKRWQRK
jgi:hypothetical protein